MDRRSQSARHARLPVCEPLEGRRYMAVNSASSLITFDLRIAGGGKAAQVENVGDVVHLELWALVRNLDGDRSNDGFEQLHTSLVSVEPDSAAVSGDIDLPTLNPAVASPGISSTGAQNNLD